PRESSSSPPAPAPPRRPPPPPPPPRIPPPPPPWPRIARGAGVVRRWMRATKQRLCGHLAAILGGAACAPRLHDTTAAAPRLARSSARCDVRPQLRAR